MYLLGCGSLTLALLVGWGALIMRESRRSSSSSSGGGGGGSSSGGDASLGDAAHPDPATPATPAVGTEAVRKDAEKREVEAPATPTRGYFEWDDAWIDIAHPDPVTPASSAAPAPATAPRSLFDSRAPAAPRTSKRLEFGFGTGPSSEPGGVLLSQAGQKHKRVRAAEAPPASVPSDPPEGVEEEQQPSVGEQATEQSQPQTPSGAESASGTATDEESVDEADGEATGGKGEQLAAQADSQPNMGSDSQPTISDWLNAKHADRRPKVKVAPRGGWWVVSLYDHSLQALRPWAEAGYKCVAFDWKHPEGKPTMDGGVERRHADLDDPATLEAIEEEFGAHTHFVSGFPPCNGVPAQRRRPLLQPGRGYREMAEQASLLSGEPGDGRPQKALARPRFRLRSLRLRWLSAKVGPKAQLWLSCDGCVQEADRPLDGQRVPNASA